MAAAKPLVSRAEVGKHNKEGDMWIIIEDKVYRVDKWLSHHPGGVAPILSVVGKDSTEPFRGFHPESVWERLKPFHVADLVLEDRHVTPAMEEFRKIHRELTNEGLFETNMSWYFFYAIWITALCFAGISGVFLGTWSAIIASAICLGIFWQQAAFLGHDLCHNAVTHVSRYDLMAACIISSVGGISADWWKSTHNIHHIVTNSLEQDPDIQHLPFLCITEKFFKNVFSKYHGRTLPFDNVAKFLVSNQHLLYYPVMGLARINLYIQSLIPHFKGKKNGAKIRFAPVDLGALIIFFSWYIVLVSFIPTWKMKLVYVILSHAVSGILHVQITISHFGMPVNDDADDSTRPYDFLKTQFEHSMDVDCPWWMDWFHGGLQFQVVHHLFPRLPRHNLRYVRDQYLIPFCKKYGYDYHHADFFTANLHVLNTLKNTAQKARDFPMEKLAPTFLYK